MFRWNDDDSVLLYKNWEAGGSDDTDLPLMDTCVALHSSTGQWENISCSDEPENGVVCQTSKIIFQVHTDTYAHTRSSFIFHLIHSYSQSEIVFCISVNAIFKTEWAKWIKA